MNSGYGNKMTLRDTTLTSDELKLLMICPDCEALYRKPRLQPREIALCTQCDRVLARYYREDVDKAFALVIACAILFVVANVTPILSIGVEGIQTEVTIWGAARALGRGWMSIAAAGLALTTLIIPFLQIASLLWVLMFAKRGHSAPGFGWLAFLLKELQPWSMTEVFLLGALVTIVKLSHWLPLEAGPGLWSLAGLSFLFAWLGRFDPEYWWALGQERVT